MTLPCTSDRVILHTAFMFMKLTAFWVVCVQASFVIPAGATFQDYVGLSLPEDEISEIPLSLKAMQGGGSSKKVKDKGNAITDEEQVCLHVTCTLMTCPHTCDLPVLSFFFSV